jgi:hypothetical protein
METEKSYNGWANYETWNVALWIGNDEGLYNEAKRFRSRGYEAFAKYMRETGKECTVNGMVPAIYIQTPDDVAWDDSGLDIEALDQMLAEL